jgi:hypothetical protein
VVENALDLMRPAGEAWSVTMTMEAAADAAAGKLRRLRRGRVGRVGRFDGRNTTSGAGDILAHLHLRDGEVGGFLVVLEDREFDAKRA